MKLLTTKSTILNDELNKICSAHCVDLSRVGLPSFLDAVEQIKPDIFWVSKWPNISVSVLKAVKKISPATRIVQWYGDFRSNISKYLAGKERLIDMILLNNREPQQVALYKKAGIKYVGTFYPSYFPTPRFYSSIKPEYDVVWGGNNYGLKKFPLSSFRFNLINTISSKFNAAVFGNGWGNIKNRQVFVKDRTDWVRALCSGQITLGANHYHAKQYYDRRLFDCMGSGRMHLTHYIPGMEKDFVNGQDLVWFKTIDEAIKLTKYYLKNPDKAAKIGSAGLNVMLTKHSWEVRAQQFLRKVSKI